jgi:hypothetical protein
VAERKKKVVQSTAAPADAAAEANGPAWTPSPEAKKQSTTFRWIAVGLWVLAIAGEAFAIFWLLRQVPFTTGHLIGLIGAIVVIGVLASVGSVLWKKANRLDPASKKDTLRFWVQNQLGVIIAIVAFLPLIILIFTNKNMDGKQKAIAGIIGIAIAAVAAFAFGADYSPVSQEQYAEETNIIEQLTGEDVVYWTTSGSVFHVCDAVPDVNRESADMTIHQGTVAQAHAEGKDRLTLKWESEATNHCGYTQEEVDAVNAAVESPADEEPADEPAPTDEETPAE